MARRDNVIQRKKKFIASNSHTKLHNTSATLLKYLNMFWDNNFVYIQKNPSEGHKCCSAAKKEADEWVVSEAQS